jgi:hypothetical protein
MRVGLLAFALAIRQPGERVARAQRRHGSIPRRAQVPTNTNRASEVLAVRVKAERRLAALDGLIFEPWLPTLGSIFIDEVVRVELCSGGNIQAAFDLAALIGEHDLVDVRDRAGSWIVIRIDELHDADAWRPSIVWWTEHVAAHGVDTSWHIRELPTHRGERLHCCDRSPRHVLGDS